MEQDASPSSNASPTGRSPFDVPDRSATASAPPDLEISSRSLFAFKAGYSGIFSDIRLDDYYESFYHENPERLNLPPPLPSDDANQHPAGKSAPRYTLPRPVPVAVSMPLEAPRPSPSPPPPPPSNDNKSSLPPAPHQKVRAPIGTIPHHQYDEKRSRSGVDPASTSSSMQHIPAANSMRYVPQHQHPRPQSAVDALWPNLNQLSLNEIDSASGSEPQSRMYPATATPTPAYPAQNPFRTPYLYPQPGSPLEPPHHHLFEPPVPQHATPGWQHQHHQNHHVPDLYEQLRYDSGAYGREDLAYAAAASTRSNPPASAGMYQNGHRNINVNVNNTHNSNRRTNNSNGRSSRKSAASNSTALGYMYAGRQVASNYLDAQAAAAAAAAAAAVYKNGGVHINGTGSFGGPSRSGSGNGRKVNGRESASGYARNTIGNVKIPGGEYGGGRNRGDFELNENVKNGTRNSEHRNTGDNNRAANGNSNNGNHSNNHSGNSTTGKLTSFNDIVGRAEELARDQHGCRFLQTKLEEGNPMYINSIFEECYEKFVDLMTDPFGNYLCQKLFEHANDAQRLALVERCAPAFPRVSTNMHGTRAVQRMVECLSTPRQVEAVCTALSPAAVQLMKDINGNHVVQRCLHRMDPAHNQFVYDAVAANCFDLATHRHGCCVMQRCMDYASPAQRNQLARQINANALPLVQNAFGNYVVQYVLGLNDPTYTAEIIRRLRGHVAELSMQKFSSNVVEKGLLQGARQLRRELIGELIEDTDTMRRLLHDAYGNYVIQRALQVAESPQLESICEAIRPHLNSLRASPYGKRIQAKIQKRMPKCLPASIVSN